jgi:hypothetical protein
LFYLNGWPSILTYAIWLLSALGVAVVISRKYGAVAGIGIAYAGFSAMRIFEVPYSPYANEDPLWALSLSLSAARTLVGVGLLIAVVYALSFKNWLRFWSLVALINSGLILVGQGILANSSMSGCLNAALLPLRFFEENPIGAAWSILVITTTFITARNQSVGLLVLIVLIACFRERLWKTLIASAIGGGFLIKLFAGSTFLQTDGRSVAWSIAFKFFKEHVNPWLGEGLGSFYYIGPWLTKSLNVRFIWLHSDWMQILFETGVVGLVLSLGVFTTAMCRAKGQIFISLALYGAWMIANFPLHNPISALLGVFLLRYSLAKSREETSTPQPSCRE